jgi:hypothetical protein
MSKAYSLMKQEELAVAREDKVRKELFSLENKRNFLIKSSREEKDITRSKSLDEQVSEIELEICYIQRELEIREKRKKFHEVFLQKKRKNRANNG